MHMYIHIMKYSLYTLSSGKIVRCCGRHVCCDDFAWLDDIEQQWNGEQEKPSCFCMYVHGYIYIYIHIPTHTGFPFVWVLCGLVAVYWPNHLTPPSHRFSPSHLSSNTHTQHTFTPRVHIHLTVPGALLRNTCTGYSLFSIETTPIHAFFLAPYHCSRVREIMGSKTWTNQSNDLSDWYLSLSIQALSIIRIRKGLVGLMSG